MRPETGPMKFDNDWRGVFIRGDNAFAYANYLYQLIHSDPKDPCYQIYKQLCLGLIDLLNSSDERKPNKEVQNLKPFQECKK
jgi:hypothetical protein